eukprot:2763862-Prymnesium_polylepis.2
MPGGLVQARWCKPCGGASRALHAMCCMLMPCGAGHVVQAMRCTPCGARHVVHAMWCTPCGACLFYTSDAADDM